MRVLLYMLKKILNPSLWDNLSRYDISQVIIQITKGDRYMRMVKITLCLIVLISTIDIFSLWGYAKYVDSSQNDSEHIISELSSEANEAENAATTERENFDIASLLSLLGIGFLKFVDDKLKIKMKDKFKTYRKLLVVTTVILCILEAAIIVCYLAKLGPVSFGNLKNVFLGLIPVVFCILTLLTAKNESNPIILNQEELEIKINDFTSSGMSPLGMIVGDMDFFGKVYNKDSKKKHPKDDITNNSQIKAIIDNNIDRIEIVCKTPTTNDAYRRIGYLLETFEGQFHIRFFDENKFPIPQMRGRIMYKQTEQVVVITKKIRKPSKYEYSEFAVSSLPGGLFADLWRTVWGCSLDCPEIIERCRKEYITYTGGQKELAR